MKELPTPPRTTLTIPDCEQLAKDNRVRLLALEDRFEHHPCWSYVLEQRVRLSGFNGDWLLCNDDGLTPICVPLHIGQVRIY